VIASTEVRADIGFDDDGRIGVLFLDAAPANVLTTQLVRSLTTALDTFEEREGQVLVIGSAVVDVFASGGDIEQLSRMDAHSSAAWTRTAS
jgi:enoyl-CoA hydratase/carnithine racemase